MTPPKNSFCFAPKFNSPQHGHPLGTDGKVLMQHDATGAFHPYMTAFKKLYSGDGSVNTLMFDNHATAANELQVISHGFAACPSQLDTVVYFGHGVPQGLVSADIYRKDIPKFAKLIRDNCGQGVKILLYACSSGHVGYPGGCFASNLASELSDMKAVVFGHHDVGHTTTNPHLYRYEGSMPGVLVAPPGKTKEFNHLIKAESLDNKPKGNSAFWARAPFMTEAELKAEVGG